MTLFVRITRPLLLSLCLIALPLAAQADPGNGKGKGKSRGSDHGAVVKHDDDLVTIRIGDRAIINDYLIDWKRKNCPPGLAKKNNGCLPPGQAKKYGVGDALPDGVFSYLPDSLLKLLAPAPRGHQYVQVDEDVFLMAEGSKKIIDGVMLLSATGD